VFFAYWTCKEAFIKALGLGLRYPLHKFAISFQPDLPPILRQFGRDSASANRWQIKCWEIAPGFSTAVVVSGNSLPKFQCC
jgi:4'-phosphopantetheinyl transferase